MSSVFPAVPNAAPLLEVDSLVGRHGGPFQLHLDAGECVAVAGRSGSGKSVLLRLIADLDPHEGDVRLGGQSRTGWTGPQWRKQVVYQAAEPAWWAPTARLHFAAGAAPDEALLTTLGLATTLLDADIARLSTGERQRMALARSLACVPRVLLLDEPTAALDSASTMAVEALIRSRLAQGLSVMWVTHSREQAARIGDRLLEMIDGRIVAP